MPNLPLPIRWILNIIFFIIYYFILIMLSGLILGFVLKIIGSYNDVTIDAASEIITLAVLPVTGVSIFFRDKFYLLEGKDSTKQAAKSFQEAMKSKDL